MTPRNKPNNFTMLPGITALKTEELESIPPLHSPLEPLFAPNKGRIHSKTRDRGTAVKDADGGSRDSDVLASGAPVPGAAAGEVLAAACENAVETCVWLVS